MSLISNYEMNWFKVLRQNTKKSKRFEMATPLFSKNNKCLTSMSISNFAKLQTYVSNKLFLLQLIIIHFKTALSLNFFLSNF